MDKVVACQTCGLVQEVDHAPQGSVIKCARCNFQIFHRRIGSRWRTLAFTLAAGILYFPSNLYPIMTAEYQGQYAQTTNGSVFVLNAKEATEWQDWNPIIPLQSLPEAGGNTNNSLLDSR